MSLNTCLVAAAILALSSTGLAKPVAGSPNWCPAECQTVSVSTVTVYAACAVKSSAPQNSVATSLPASLATSVQTSGVASVQTSVASYNTGQHSHSHVHRPHYHNSSAAVVFVPTSTSSISGANTTPVVIQSSSGSSLPLSNSASGLFVGPSSSASMLVSTAVISVIPIPSNDCQHDNCLRHFIRHPTISGFCATYTTAVNTATTGLPAYASYCSGLPARISSACSCVFNGAITPASTSSGAGGVVTSLPITSSAGSMATSFPVSSGAAASVIPTSVSSSGPIITPGSVSSGINSGLQTSAASGVVSQASSVIGATTAQTSAASAVVSQASSVVGASSAIGATTTQTSAVSGIVSQASSVIGATSAQTSTTPGVVSQASSVAAPTTLQTRTTGGVYTTLTTSATTPSVCPAVSVVIETVTTTTTFLVTLGSNSRTTVALSSIAAVPALTSSAVQQIQGNHNKGGRW